MHAPAFGAMKCEGQSAFLVPIGSDDWPVASKVFTTHMARVGAAQLVTLVGLACEGRWMGGKGMTCCCKRVRKMRFIRETTTMMAHRTGKITRKGIERLTSFLACCRRTKRGANVRKTTCDVSVVRVVNDCVAGGRL